MSNATLQRTARSKSPSEARLEPTSTATPSRAFRSDKITDEHLARLAIVYVRQSSPQQVQEVDEVRVVVVAQPAHSHPRHL